MTESAGWVGHRPNDPAIHELRDHLDANGGIADLAMHQPDEVRAIVERFDRDGFAVVDGLLEADQLRALQTACETAVDEITALDPECVGNRGSHRYSFGASSLTNSMLHLPAWQALIDLPRLTPLLEAIFGSADYSLRAASGDFCLPGAVEYQPLHSDMGDYVSPTQTPFSSFSDRRGLLTTRDLPTPYLCVNFLMIDATASNGSTRQIPGTQNSRDPIPRLDDEPEWMRLSTVCPAPAGAAMIRDVRTWHGGTPNLSQEIRAIPNVEFYAPWFREPLAPAISRHDYDQLSDRARHVARYSVLDSSEHLETGYELGTTPGRRRS